MSDATLQGQAARPAAPHAERRIGSESPLVQVLLIAVSLAFLTLFLLLPIARRSPSRMRSPRSA
jgi:sulfate transport system permease protein